MKLKEKLSIQLLVLWLWARLHYATKKLPNPIRQFALNVRAASGPATVATIAVSVIILAYLLPIGLLAIADANVTGWVAVVVTMFQTVLPILIIVGIALKYVPRR